MPPVADRNYFELFGLPVAYELDVVGLTARYRELAREAHPDRFAGGSDFERRLAIQTTTLLNEAFRVLKDPIARASYLLALNGAGAVSSTAVAVDPALLMEQMELRERLDESRRNRVGLDAMLRDVRRLLKENEQRLHRQLSPTAWQPEQALRTLQEMQFLEKLRQQIAELEEEFS